MKLRTVNEVDLGIDADTVRLFAEKARAISSGVSEDYEDGRDHEVEFEGDGSDSHRHDGLVEEESEDMTEDELRALIADLNVDEAAALVALAWIGRGDYSGDEWEDALAAARQRANSRTADYLLGMPMLGEWLEEGLEAVGV
jgi:hypothetical protein